MDDQTGQRQAIPPGDSMRYRAIYKLWPDFPVKSQIYRSVATIKSDAANRSFGAAGAGIVWAVIDSGIAGDHPHFDLDKGGHTLMSPEVRDLHRCFIDSESSFAGVPFLAPAPADPDSLERPATNAGPEARQAFLEKRKTLIEEHRTLALTDDFGHGTHVAGIIAGAAKAGRDVRLLERVEQMNSKGELERGQFQQTGTLPPKQVRGMAPNCRLISLRVLDGNGDGRSSDVIRALDYVRERLNDNPKLLRVHGVNLSVGYEFDAERFACGQSPICAQVNRLVQSGVVVVAAAGNTGYGTVAASVRATKVDSPTRSTTRETRNRRSPWEPPIETHPTRSVCRTSRPRDRRETVGSSPISWLPGSASPLVARASASGGQHLHVGPPGHRLFVPAREGPQHFVGHHPGS